MTLSLDLVEFWTALWSSRIIFLGGIWTTILVSLLSIAIGTVIGVFVGLALTYLRGPVYWLFRLYTDFIRGTPVLVLVLASFYILGTIGGLKLDAFEAGVLALSIFCSSHVGEIVRGALQAIPRGQTEASKAIGLTFTQTFVYVLLPQAARQGLPAWVNTAAEIVKASTLLAIIGVAELLLTSQELIARTFLSLEFYFFAGFVYFLINFSIERLGKAIEKRLAISTH
jgi:polar amino acid transport system permease protein